MEPVAVANDYYQRAEDRTDWGVSARTGGYRFARNPSRPIDDPGKRFDRAPARAQARPRLPAGFADDGESSASAVGLSEKSRSKAVSGPHSASRHPQVVGRAFPCFFQWTREGEVFRRR